MRPPPCSTGSALAIQEEAKALAGDEFPQVDPVAAPLVLLTPHVNVDKTTDEQVSAGAGEVA
jgi:hypothetical protein